MRILMLVLSGLFCFSALAQEQEERLDTQVDRITYSWDLESHKLSTYEGLRAICTDKEYANKVLSMLKEIHHLDSVLYNVLTDLSKNEENREIRQTLKDIKKLEEGYDTASFVEFMNEECRKSGEIEKNADDTRNSVGEISYSGQVYILETELYKYVNQITNRIDKIRNHVHHISPRYK